VTLRTVDRSTARRPFGGVSGHHRATARPGLRGGLRPVRAGTGRTEAVCWHRIVDDRDLVGAKVTALAVLLALTALLERVV
jgi:hypothetical protein